MTTIIATEDYMKKIIDLKKEGKLTMVKTVISMNGGAEKLNEAAGAVGLHLMNWDQIMKNDAVDGEPLNETEEFDTYIFSYTSGTTGDSKGVKLNHKNILSTVECVITKMITEWD